MKNEKDITELDSLINLLEDNNISCYEISKRRKNLYKFMNRFLRVLAFPFIFITMIQIIPCLFLSIFIWIVTGKSIADWSYELLMKHISYCLGDDDIM